MEIDYFLLPVDIRLTMSLTLANGMEAEMTVCLFWLKA